MTQKELYALHWKAIKLSEEPPAPGTIFGRVELTPEDSARLDELRERVTASKGNFIPPSNIKEIP